jgi:uncharacterized membrane protein
MKEFRLVQHTLIPFALLVANTAVAHFIYLLSEGLYGYMTAAIFIGLLILAAGILRSNKYALSGGIVFYILLLLFTL